MRGRSCGSGAGLDYFCWIEDGKIQFGFMHEEDCSEEVLDELVESMERIDSVYPPPVDLHEGPAFLLTEHLTGTTLMPQRLQESTYLCGVVPERR
ncbi:hypothetical protein GCM10020219_061980 [Nonomuraea dietziae]